MKSPHLTGVYLQTFLFLCTCTLWLQLSEGFIFLVQVTKGGFFSKSAMKFFQISKSQKENIPKNYLEVLPITVKCYWREI